MNKQDFSWQEHVNRNFPGLIVICVVVLALMILIGYAVV